MALDLWRRERDSRNTGQVGLAACGEDERKPIAKEDSWDCSLTEEVSGGLSRCGHWPCRSESQGWESKSGKN